jgi:hypothetical protein
MFSLKIIELLREVAHKVDSLSFRDELWVTPDGFLNDFTELVLSFLQLPHAHHWHASCLVCLDYQGYANKCQAISSPGRSWARRDLTNLCIML